MYGVGTDSRGRGIDRPIHHSKKKTIQIFDIHYRVCTWVCVRAYSIWLGPIHDGHVKKRGAEMYMVEKEGSSVLEIFDY